MEENNRINRRSRPRPYDLRRKVLLKNFLREQMTYIPETRVDLLSQNNDATNSESSISDPINNLPELNDNESSADSAITDDQMSTDLVETDPFKLDSISDDSSKIDDSVMENSLISEPVAESGVFKFTRFMKFKRDSKKSFKGVFKAKEVCKSVKGPMKTRSFKSGIERVFSFRKRPNETSSKMSRNSSKAPFSLFKYRRQQRNLKDGPQIKISPLNISEASDSNSKHNTSNQSVQTDDSWAKEELARVQQSNKRLKEENRLLTESLSYLMSNSAVDLQTKNCSSPLQSSNKNINNSVYPDYYVTSNSSSSNWNSRPRVSRSRSVHEYNERRSMLRNNYRTRSMNYHNYRNNSSTTSNDTQFQGINIPRVRRSSAMNLPVSSSVRSIQRRSSMPERVLSENDRTMVCRRTGSVRDIKNRKPFHSLPSEAFY